jgi:hypothetical protein
MHYSETMEFTRRVVKDGAIGEITTAGFHGGCPSGAGMDLWQAIPEGLGGIMHTEGCHTLEMSWISSGQLNVLFPRLANCPNDHFDV